MSEELNRKLVEAQGKCWHEWPRGPGVIACVKCSADYTHQPNPDYCNDISACLGNGGLVEWMRREKGWYFSLISTEALWIVRIHQDMNAGALYKAGCKSLPTAIAKVCAKALGIELEKEV